MEYIEVLIQGPAHLFEILVAELSLIDFDHFEERDTELAAYQPAEKFDDTALKQIIEQYALQFPLSYTIKKIPYQNWNAEWESNFQPVALDDFLYIRAPFHPDAEGYKYRLVIQPKMSFGTGHHPTTLLMIRQMALIDLVAKQVLDAGTGTGILAIMAEKMGAKLVEAYDFDSVCVENSLENLALNQCRKIHVFEARAERLMYEDGHFEVILANINRNVLLHDLPIYARLLKSGGNLIMSGFYIQDVPILHQEAEKQGLKKTNEITSGEWACVRFMKE